MKTVTALFDSPDDALSAAERAKEIAGRRATVRVFVRGANGSVIEASVVGDSSGWARVWLFGVVVGIVGAMVAEALGASWMIGSVGLLAGVLGGVLIGVWLTGEAYPRRILAGWGELRFPYERVVREGKAVVTACVRSHHAAEQLIELFEEEGGRVVEGFLHEWPGGVDELLPQV